MSLFNWHGFRALITGKLERLIIRVDVGVTIRRIFRHKIIPSLKFAHLTGKEGLWLRREMPAIPSAAPYSGDDLCCRFIGETRHDHDDISWL